MFLTQAVKIGLEGDNAIQQHGKSNWWLPIKWSISIVKNAMTEERVAHPPSYAALVKSIATFRASLTEVLTYGHVTLPLVYTQVSLQNVPFKPFNMLWRILHLLNCNSGCASCGLFLLCHRPRGETVGSWQRWNWHLCARLPRLWVPLLFWLAQCGRQLIQSIWRRRWRFWTDRPFEKTCESLHEYCGRGWRWDSNFRRCQLLEAHDRRNPS